MESYTSIGAIALVASALLVLSVSALGAGQAVGIKHPVLEHKIDPANAAQYEKAVERVMAMDEEEMLAFVPDRPMMVFCQCPNCWSGTYSGIFSWTVDQPEQMTCKYCGTVYQNEKYPDDRTIEGANAQGEPFSYRYYHSDEKGINLFFRAHILMFKRGWILNQCRDLAVAYAATGKPEYARRAALILDQIAQYYPHYPAMKQWITTFEFPAKQEPPWPRAGGKWGRWMESEIPEDSLIYAYDLIYDSPVLDELSQARGYDVRENIESNFLKATWEYVQTFGEFTDNIAPSYLISAARIGQVINEPHYVHWAYHWLKEILYGGCFYDGMWHEAPSYHYQTLVRVGWDFDELTGYSDPPGYVDAVYGERFDNLDPKRDNPFIARALDAPAVLDLPTGVSTPVHDTWANEQRSKPRMETISTITPGYGHASLGRGTAGDQIQTQLHFSGAYGHSHLDCLNLLLFAKGREMLCDLGYTHTQVRKWNISTIAHNLVAIDRRDQRGGNSDGDLLAYYPDLNGVSMVEADGVRAYGDIEGVDLYRRLLLTVPVSASDAYVVDIFRVQGGQTHDWLLHGSGDDDMTATCDIDLPGHLETMLEEGEAWVEPRDEQSQFNVWGVLRGMAAGAADGAVTTTFTYLDEPAKAVRAHVTADGPMQVFLGKSLSPRRAGNDTQKAFDYWMPQLVVRRQGEGPLRSCFAAVEEPFDGKPFIGKVERVALTPADANAVALRITHGSTVDTIISTMDEAPYPERSTADGVRLQGRLGLLRTVGGVPTGGWLFEGGALSADGWSIEPERSAYTGGISDDVRVADGGQYDAFVTDADLPVGNALSGVWMIVTHGNGYTHGYEIERIAEVDGKRHIIVSYDHGLQIEGSTTKEFYFPQRTIEGINTFRIPLGASVTRGR